MMPNPAAGAACKVRQRPFHVGCSDDGFDAGVMNRMGQDSTRDYARRCVDMQDLDRARSPRATLIAGAKSGIDFVGRRYFQNAIR